MDYVVSAHGLTDPPAIYLSDELGTGKSVQWQFHLVTHCWADLWERTKYFSIAGFDPGGSPPAACWLCRPPTRDARVSGRHDQQAARRDACRIESGDGEVLRALPQIRPAVRHEVKLPLYGFPVPSSSLK